MVVYSELLQEAIDQLMEHDQISTMDALFNFGSVDLMNTSIEGMDDFELICFFILMKGVLMIRFPSYTALSKPHLLFRPHKREIVIF